MWCPGSLDPDVVPLFLASGGIEQRLCLSGRSSLSAPRLGKSEHPVRSRRHAWTGALCGGVAGEGWGAGELIPLTVCVCVCVCVCVFFAFILDIKFVGRTSRGHTGERSHRISHPPSFCGACLNFSREKDSAIPFPRRPCSRILCTNDFIVLDPLGIFSFVF